MGGTQSGMLLINYHKIYNDKVYELMNGLVLQAVASIQSDGVNHIDAFKSDDSHRNICLTKIARDNYILCTEVIFESQCQVPMHKWSEHDQIVTNTTYLSKLSFIR